MLLVLALSILAKSRSRSFFGIVAAGLIAEDGIKGWEGNFLGLNVLNYTGRSAVLRRLLLLKYQEILL